MAIKIRALIVNPWRENDNKLKRTGWASFTKLSSNLKENHRGRSCQGHRRGHGHDQLPTPEILQSGMK